MTGNQLNRKQLPPFGYINHIKVDTDKLLAHCKKENLLDPRCFDDINVRVDPGNFVAGDLEKEKVSKLRDFVVLNEFNREKFTAEDESGLQGEKYRQLYFTEFDISKKSKHISSKQTNIFGRSRRLDPSNKDYIPEADEHNYGVRNSLVKGEIEKILNKFKAPLGRVRFTYLEPGFSIKAHIDYDPSYVTRFHIPILTNEECLMCTIKGNTHFPADGKVYFFNTGIKHWVENNSKFPRIHLIIDVHDQRDLVNLTEINSI